MIGTRPNPVRQGIAQVFELADRRHLRARLLIGFAPTVEIVRIVAPIVAGTGDEGFIQEGGGM